MSGPRPAGARLKPALFALAVVACGAALAACGSSSSTSTTSTTAASSAASSAATSASSSAQAATGSPINVAIISFKIPGIDELTPITAGAEGAASVINSEGGFGGHPVHIITCNSMLAPGPATICAHSTIAQHPITMMGCELGWSVSGLPIYTAAKVPSLNCLNNPQDFASKWDFGLNNGEAGDNAGVVEYLCSLKSVHRVVTMATAAPSTTAIEDDVVTPLLKQCGISNDVIYVPPTVVDLTPDVQKALQSHPQAVLGNIQNAQVPQMFTEFEQNGIPASRITSSDVDYTAAMLKAAPQMKGGIDAAEFDPWTDTSNPSVAQYDQVMSKRGSPDYRDPSVEWGWSLMMWVYQSAKAIGFSNVSGAALQHYWSTVNGVAIPLSLTWTNPGPAAAQAVKQPSELVLQWTGTAFVPVPGGSNGWFDGLVKLQ